MPLFEPSSQVSPPITFPSPQTVVQTVIFPGLQVKPASSVQVDEQPSPEVEPPSSHYSFEIKMPSPHDPGQIVVTVGVP